MPISPNDAPGALGVARVDSAVHGLETGASDGILGEKEESYVWPLDTAHYPTIFKAQRDRRTCMDSAATAIMNAIPAAPRSICP